MRDCAVCGMPVDGLVCTSCGAGVERKKGAPTFDPDWRLCANVDAGLRCANAGVMSHSTRGGGPWYCRAHFFPNDMHRLACSVYWPTVQLEEHEKRNDGRNWARLVLKRHAAGEALPMVSVEMANEAIKAKRGPSHLPSANPPDFEAVAERIAIATQDPA